MATSSPELKFLVLGQLDVVANGESGLGGPKQRAVLGMLVSHVGQAVSNDQLIEGIWGPEPPKEVRTSLRSYVSNLRTAVGAEIARIGSGYVLNADPAAVDAIEFQRLMTEGTRSLSANPEAASNSLRAGLGLWRGKPYADLLEVEGLQGEIRRLEELRLGAVEARIDADLALGRHQVLVGELAALATEYPLRERFQSQLMVALYRDGRQSEALRAYQRTSGYLRDELGVDPSEDLQELELRILNHDPDLLTIRDTVTEHVAFLFTDISGSTELWETRAPAMRAALARHDEILSTAIEDAGGRLFKHTGDGVLAAFPTVVAAANAAVDSQRGFLAGDWGDLDLQVRMAVDVGEVDARGGDYFGPPMNRGSRVMSAAYGGQILLSEPAQQALSAEPGIQVRSLGEHRMKGLGAPIRVFQLVVDGLPLDFPDLRLDAATAGPARQFGDSIRGYELRERLSAGRVSVVYRAFQPMVGREVAVKVIRPEYANHPSFVRRFESEARTVAGLEHPHIVSLYDYWRDSLGAYLVMPLMVGGSLSDKNLGALSLERVVGLVGQVGAALGYAHRQGVIHRAIKPSNILLDADGNAYLADFGIAVRAVERDAGIQSDSAIHRAPEDRAGGAVDERSDVYSLASVIAGLLTGSDSAVPDLTPLDGPLQKLLRTALAENPESRPETVDSFVGRLSALSGGMTVSAEPIVSRNPYKGLQAFDVDDSRDFFGRDDEIRRLIELVGQQRIVTVVGPSGSGKSSLVRAGLLPALATGALPGSDQWITITTLPGSHPFDELASVLGEVATESMGDMAAELASDDRGLLRLSKRLMRDLEGELVIVVDQFEELYTVVTSDEMRRSFVVNLIEATSDARSRVRVVLTLRADFYDHPLADELLGPIVSEANLALAVPQPAQLREAIERPASNAGVVFEDGLTDQLLSDVQEQPGSLPLMQFSLAALVTQSLDGRVSIADYERLGGVSGSLTQRADDVYTSLEEEEQATAEEVFMRLVSVSEEADDVRRRVRLSELESLGLEAGAVVEVLRKFGKARLLTFDRDTVTRGPTVEVAHEALLRSWGRFRGWLDARREALILHRRFRAAESEWREADRDGAYLLTGGRLYQFETWAAGSVSILTPDETEFLDESVAAQNQAETRRRRIRRGVLAGFATAAVIASILGIYANGQRGDALANAAEATARELSQAALAITVDDPELGILLAAEALQINEEAGAEPMPEALSALWTAYIANRVEMTLPGVGYQAVAYSQDGSELAIDSISSGHGLVTIWDPVVGAEIGRLPSSTADAGGVVWDIEYSPDGKWIAVARAGVEGGGATVEVFDASTRRLIHRYGGDQEVYLSLSFSDTGMLAAIGETTLTMPLHLTVWDMTTGDAASSLTDIGILATSIAFAPGTNEVVIGLGASVDQPARVIAVNALSGETTWQFPIDFDPWNLALSPSADRVAVVNADSSLVVVYEVPTGRRIFEPVAHQNPQFVTWSPDGNLISVSGNESDITLLDGATGTTHLVLSGHTASVLSTSFHPSGDFIASASTSGEVRVWNITTEGSAAGTALASGADVLHLEVTDNNVILSLTDVGAWVVDQAAGTVTSEHDYIIGVPTFAVVAKSADQIAGIDPEGTTTITDLDTGSSVSELPRCSRPTALSPDARYTVLDSFLPRFLEDCGEADDPVSGVYDVISRDVHIDFQDQFVMFGEVTAAQTFDGMRYAAVVLVEGENSWVEIWTLDPHRLLGRVTQEMAGNLFHLLLSFSSDGRYLAVGTNGARVLAVDIAALQAGSTIEEAIVFNKEAHTSNAPLAHITDDGIIATSGFDGFYRFWDLSTGELRFEIEVEGLQGHGAHDFSPDFSYYYYEDGNGVIRRMPTDVSEMIELAMSSITRDLTDDECLRYLHTEGCISSTR